MDNLTAKGRGEGHLFGLVAMIRVNCWRGYVIFRKGFIEGSMVGIRGWLGLAVKSFVLKCANVESFKTVLTF